MEYILPFVGVLIVVVIVFIALREVACWYFKINKLVSLQKLIAETQLKIYEQKGGKVDWEKIKKVLHE
jgi:hypothetical protein